MSAETVIAEMKAAVRRAAEPVPGGEQVQVQQERAAKRLGLSVQSVRKLWYGNRKIIPAELYVRMKARVADLERRHLELHRAHTEIDQRISDIRREGLGLGERAGLGRPDGLGEGAPAPFRARL